MLRKSLSAVLWRRHVVRCILLCVGATSCKHVYYVPPAQHVSLFQNEGEWRATTALGYGEESNTFDAQGSYALTDRFAVMSGLQLAWGGRKNDSSNWGQGYLLDAAFGYYKPLNKYLVFEVYGGFRHGFQQHYYAAGRFSLSGDMQLQTFGQFVQPSLGLTFRQADFAVTSGIQHLAFYDFKAKERLPSPDYLDGLLRQTSGLFWEPGLTARVGWQQLQFQFQFVRMVPLTDVSVTLDDFKYSLGISYALTKRAKTARTTARPPSRRGDKRFF